MSVKGKSIYHCHGKSKGKKYRTYSSKQKAKVVHRAIMAKKSRKKGGNKYTKALANG